MPRTSSIKFIPGAVNSATGKGIPWMTGLYGEGVYNAGVNARLLGFKSTVRSLNMMLNKLHINSYEGLEGFAQFLYNDMLVTSPTIPKDDGELRDSWYTKRIIYAGAAIEAGFSAPYALYVHEMTDDAYMKKIDWTTGGSGAKFFQKSIQRNVKLMQQLVAVKTRITG